MHFIIYCLIKNAPNLACFFILFIFTCFLHSSLAKCKSHLLQSARVTLRHCARPVATLLARSLTLPTQNVCPSALLLLTFAFSGCTPRFVCSGLRTHTYTHMYLRCVCVCDGQDVLKQRGVAQRTLQPRRDAARDRAGDFISLPHSHTHTHKLSTSIRRE